MKNRDNKANTINNVSTETNNDVVNENSNDEKNTNNTTEKSETKDIDDAKNFETGSGLFHIENGEIEEPVLILSDDNKPKKQESSKKQETPEKPKEQEEPKTPEEPKEQEEPDTPEKPEHVDIKFEEYMKMTSKEQYKYFLTFESQAAFTDWYNKAKQEYDSSLVITQIEEGDIAEVE